MDRGRVDHALLAFWVALAFVSLSTSRRWALVTSVPRPAAFTWQQLLHEIGGTTEGVQSIQTRPKGLDPTLGAYFADTCVVDAIVNSLVHATAQVTSHKY